VTHYQPGPQQPPFAPPRQKHTVRNALLIVGLVLVLAYPAYSGVKAVWESQQTHQVVYKVTGTSHSVDVNYSREGDGMKTKLSGQGAPWQSETLSLKGAHPLLQIFANVTVGTQGGGINCEIWMDGKLVARGDADDSYVTTCLHVPGRS
jgi:hypothetical protein